MPLNKLPDLVLSYSMSNHLFCKVSNHLASQRKVLLSQTINLINKNALLSVGETLVDLILEYRARGGFALNTPYQHREYQIVLSSDISIIRSF